MATASIASPPAVRPAAIAAVLARSGQWTQARRKSDGRSFFIVPGSTLGAAYYADAESCTCPSAQNRPGPCKHTLAVAEHLARRAPKSDAEMLEQLQADQTAHARTLLLTGWTPDELLEHPVYAQRAGHIARLEARLSSTAVA